MPQSLKNIRKELRQLPSYKYAPKRNINKYPVLEVIKSTFNSRISPGIKSLYFKIVVKGEVNEDRPEQQYLTQVQFFKVEFSDEYKRGYTETEINGKPIYFKPPTVSTSEVKLKCQCQDFRFYWEKELYDNKSLIGNWRRYVRKTPPPPEGRPYVNPDELVGYCKHIHNFLEHLKSEGYMK